MAVTSIWRVHGRVGKVLDYVENVEKTTAVSTGDGDLSNVKAVSGAMPACRKILSKNTYSQSFPRGKRNLHTAKGATDV